jgi:predicted anti-sigma-YlaC factor YlaD
MTGRAVNGDTSAHAAADALLPWYVNGTLKGEELAFVTEHVARCERCRREVDFVRDVFAACGALSAGERGHAPTQPSVPAGRAPLANAWRSAHPWIRGLLAAELAAITVLATLLVVDVPPSAPYRTLGTVSRAAIAHDQLAVTFDASSTEADIRGSLHAAGARIVDGPTSSGVFVLEVPAGRADEALRALRAAHAVRFAERLGPGTGR